VQKTWFALSMIATCSAACFALSAHSRPSLGNESSAQVSSPSNAPVHQSLSSFSALRHQVLNEIAGAQTRIWLVTDYLTDGEIVSALYLAQYRRLDVQVLLGREKSRSYMSRLDYLRTQNISVFLKPEEFPFKNPTAMIVDERLIFVDAPLNFMDDNRNFNWSVATSTIRNQFVSAFRAATSQRIPAIPRPIPQVGRGQNQISSSPGASGSGAASFNYDRGSRQTAAPEGLPTRLPGETIWQRRQREQVEKSVNQ